jgi:phosphoenolpyruvate-protein phosphotransferase (PTS system enzyme I)
MTHSRALYGIGVSPGVAVGPAVVLRVDLPEVPHRLVPPEAVDAEVVRLEDAVGTVRQSLERLRTRAFERVGPEEAKIFDAQILMLEDREFLQQVEELILENQLTAERAFEFKALELKSIWEASPARPLRDKVADLSALQRRVLNQLLGLPSEDQRRIEGRPAVIVTHELTPGLTIEFERDHVIGFVSEEGTRTAHAAILARSLGIPCVMGLPHALERIPSGSEVVLDGTQGLVLVSPSAEEIEEARAVDERRRTLLEDLDRLGHAPASTTDGHRLALRGNLDLPEELEALAEHGAEGVGLLRTEFLVIGRSTLPDEEEQVEYFRRVARRFPGQPVTVRSYDVGGDKFPAAFRIGTEANPFLGWRAIRVCLDRPEVFLPQLRALLRARIEGDVRLMLPMIVEAAEIVRTRELVATAAEELCRDGLPAADDLPIGVMVETPAAVMVADDLARHAAFFSVGTNDLTQYTLALDRGNARLAERFSPFHPAVLRMLRHVRQVSAAHGTPIAVCGEMASEPLGVFLLLGLGYREFSAAPTAVPLVRWLVQRLSVGDAERAAAEALEALTAPDVLALVERRLAACVDLDLVDAGWLPGHRRPATLHKRRS